MATIVGGKRARLVKDSVYHVIDDGLRALGWYDPARRHLPVTFIPEAQDIESDIPLNTLALSDEGKQGTNPAEMGTSFADHMRGYYVDLFAESDALGLELIEDVHDILDGRMPSIGRANAIVDVYDWTTTGTPHLFYCDVVGLFVDRAHDFPHPYLRHWYSIQFQLDDRYGDSNDAR